MTITGGGTERLSSDELVVSSQRRLLRLALMLSGGVHSAEDLVQTVLARAHGRWDRIGVLDKPDAYLSKMVVNEFLSWRRRLKNQELPLADLSETPATDDISTRQAQRDAAWRTPPAAWPTCEPTSRPPTRTTEMPKLTDEEVGQLLRETFADKENLADQLPEATTLPVRTPATSLTARRTSRSARSSSTRAAHRPPSG